MRMLPLFTVLLLVGLVALPSCADHQTPTSSAPSATSSSSVTSTPDSGSSLAGSQASTTVTAPSGLTGVKAEMWTEIQRVREGVASGSLVFQWDPGPDSEFPSDPMEFLDSLEKKLFTPDVTLYLKDEAGEALALREELIRRPELSKLVFVSKDDALAQMKEDYKDHPEILENLQSNPLPASIEIWLKNPNQAPSFAAELENRPEVDEVRTGTAVDYALWLAVVRGLTRPATRSDVKSAG